MKHIFTFTFPPVYFAVTFQPHDLQLFTDLEDQQNNNNNKS